MAADNKKQKLIKVTSPKGTFKFPKLNTPDTKFKAEGEYGVKLIVSREDAIPLLAQLEDEAENRFNETKETLTAKVAEEKGEKKAKAKKELENLKRADLPVKDCVDDDGEPNGDIEINFKMKAQRTDKATGKIIKMTPKFFDAKGKELKGGAIPQVWGGTVGYVAGSIVPFYTAAVGAGASLRLAAVQIIELVTAGGGNADSFGFGKDEDGYEADESPAESEGFSDQSPAGEAGEGDDF